MKKITKDCKCSTDGINTVSFKEGQIVDLSKEQEVILKGSYKNPTKKDLAEENPVEETKQNSKENIAE